jgi:hypothetical protein
MVAGAGASPSRLALWALAVRWLFPQKGLEAKVRIEPTDEPYKGPSPPSGMALRVDPVVISSTSEVCHADLNLSTIKNGGVTVPR